MLYYHVKAGVDPVFRLQKNIYKEIKEFRISDQVDQIITLNPSKDTSRDIKKKFPDITVIPLKFRLIKYTIAETTYKKGKSISKIKVNFKNCLATVSRHLEEIMFVPVNCDLCG